MNLREFRKNNNLTQQEFADIVSKNDFGFVLPRTTYQHYEYGRKVPNKAKMAIKIAQENILKVRLNIYNSVNIVSAYERIDQMTMPKKFSLITKLKALWFALVHSWKDGVEE